MRSFTIIKFLIVLCLHCQAGDTAADLQGARDIMMLNGKQRAAS